MAPRLDIHLSRVLLDEGLASVEVLEDAAQQQLIHGGALDTLLLELDIIDETTLAHAVARAWGTPLIDTRQLDVAPADAARWLPERIAISLAICPFAEVGDALHVIVAAPLDRGLLDEVGLLVKRPLVPHVVPEVRLWDVLHRAYDAVIDERLVSLLRHLERSQTSTARKKIEPRLVVRPPDLGETRWDIVEALAHLAAQDHRAGIADVAVRYARQFLPFAAIFGVHHEMAIGWRRSGPADGPQFESMALPVPAGSVLSQVLESPSPLLGKPPVTDGNAAFFGWLGRRRPRTALLIPVIVARRPVAVLVADGGVRAQTFDALSDLVAFGARLGVSFEALLRARHRAHPEIFAEKGADTHGVVEKIAESPSPSPSITDEPKGQTSGHRSTNDDDGTREKPRASSRDGTSPFARGYVAPKPKGPADTHTPTLTMSGDGSWNLVMQRKGDAVHSPESVSRAGQRRDALAASGSSRKAEASSTLANLDDKRVGGAGEIPRDDELRTFEEFPSSSEIASFEKGPTSTEIASFEDGDTPHPLGPSNAVLESGDNRPSIVVGEALTIAPTAMLPPDENLQSVRGSATSSASTAVVTQGDDDFAGVTGMYRLLPRDSGDVDEAAFSAAIALQQTRASALDDVDRVSLALDAAETGGFLNLLEQRRSTPIDDSPAPWTNALVDTIASGRQGGTATSSEVPVLADGDEWEDVVLDRAYAAALRAPTLVRASDNGVASPPGDLLDGDAIDGDDLDDDDVDALILEATKSPGGAAEVDAAPIADVDDDAILAPLADALLETGPTPDGARAAAPTAPANAFAPVVGQEVAAVHDVSPRATTDAPKPGASGNGVAAPARVASPEELVGMLDSLYADRIAEAKRHILELGRAAVPALTEAFPGRLLVDPFANDVRIERCADLGPLIEVCEQLGPMGLDVAIPHLDSRFPAHRFAATFLFVVVPDERAIDVLRPRLHDFETRIQTVATAGLSQFMAHPRFMHVLTHLRQRLNAPSHEARERAASLLGNFRDVGAIPALMRLLDEKGSLGEAAHGALLRITLVDHGPKSRAWEKWWERARQKTRIDWLIEALRHKERDVRFVAATELQEITGNDFGYDCDQAKRDREDAVRRVEAWWVSERAAIGT